MAGIVLRVIPDAANANNLRIIRGDGPLCKVYGWSPDDARKKADMIVAALRAQESSR